MYLINRLREATKLMRDRGLGAFVKRYFYLKREWIVVRKNLKNLDFKKYNYQKDDISLVKISKDNFNKRLLSMQEFNDYYRVLSYLDKGYEGYMLKRSDEFLGYIWWSLIGVDMKNNHPDVKHLKITHRESSAYMFDMYLKEVERGNNMATYILNSLMLILKDKGVVKAYALFRKNNIPALWIHRMLKFKEIRELKISQLGFYKYTSNMEIEENL